MKEKKSCITLPLNDNGPGAAFFSMGEITKVDFSADSYQVAFGNEKGKVQLYDIRYPLPVQTFTHHYRLPIKAIKFH